MPECVCCLYKGTSFEDYARLIVAIAMRGRIGGSFRVDIYGFLRVFFLENAVAA